MNKALFLDRDGVINEDCHYPHKPEQIVFREGIFDLCRFASDKGYLIVVVTNQAGVAKGYFTEEDLISLHEWMREQFLDEGIAITSFYYCPCHPDAVHDRYRQRSPFRKPAPGMVLQAVDEHIIDLTKSLMVGDKQSDRIAVEGLRSLILKSKYTQNDYDITSLEEVYEYLT
ncbi:MAG: D-glycero-alpha-D-manno-heptose-1,7-bisphosphate 7-phosphatase [Chitinispirillaceae bacterium]